jgi:hypothetical protein
VRKTARNYGEEWRLNYELKRLGMHGGGGVGNSKARRQVLGAANFQSGKERAARGGRSEESLL